MYDGIRVSAIAAVASNGVIGKDGKLPWRIPDDLKRFQRLTKRHAIIMGRKTLDELQTPLKFRLNVVLSRSLVREDKRLSVVRTLDEAFAEAAAWERRKVADGKIETPEIFLIGGAEIWRLAWPHIDRFYRTHIDAEFAGDTVFPDVDLSDFDATDERHGEGEPPHRFVTWDRRR